MPFTGTDFANQFNLQTDQAYTGYFDPAKLNRLANTALTKSVEEKVASNDRIQVQDDLFGIFKTNAPFTPASNQVSLIAGGSGITDYHHAMNVKAKFIVLIQNLYIASATNSTPIRITLSGDTNLRTYDVVLLSGITTNTNANGVRYLKRYKNDLYELFSDANLLTPVAGNGLYTGVTGQISRIIYNTAYDLKSGRKFSRLSEPTIYDPYYEIANTVMKIYPQNHICSEVQVDYVSTPTPIDVNNSTTDLLATFSQRFLDYVIDRTCILAGESMRDNGLISNSTNEIMQP